jgi:hypothetical protein
MVWTIPYPELRLRSIGLARAQTQLGLKNLVYNLKRFVYLETQATEAAEWAR